MDPNANLAELLRLVALVQTDLDRCENDGATACALYYRRIDIARALELVAALHGWLNQGGFLPDAWSRAGHRRIEETT